jgi:dihydrofolate reductase
MKQISIIVAIAQNHAIGKDNDLLWHISNDFKWFKEKTRGHQVIMGKRTLESLPNGPLPKRSNIVITDKKGEIFDGCTTVYSIDEAIEQCSDTEESFIIGGGSIYKQFLEYANKFYLTRIHKDFDADTFFEVDFSDWNITYQEDVNDDSQNDFDYSFIIYERK